jgi:hypothetical protein
VGTASILAAHGAECSVVCAGLLHSAYTHGDFGDGRDRDVGEVAPARREIVRRVLGEAGEDLVYGYRGWGAARRHGSPPEAVTGLSPRERSLFAIRLAWTAARSTPASASTGGCWSGSTASTLPWRSELGLLEEHCPHRQSSLATATGCQQRRSRAPIGGRARRG